MLIENNIIQDSFSFTKKKCEFCGNQHKDHCPLLQDERTLEEMNKVMRQNRDFNIMMVWGPEPHAELGYLTRAGKSAVQEVNEFRSRKGPVSVYDCLSAFSKEETLTGDEKWYCPRCKTHVEATKKMDLYKVPRLLIIQLKRFSRDRVRSSFYGMVSGASKNSEFVDFPVKGLDITEYVKGGAEGQSHVYDLYGVVCHSGSLYGGHYTAYCYNPVVGRWLDYNDSWVSGAAEKDVVDASAYILFYRRRDAGPNEITHPMEI